MRDYAVRFRQEAVADLIEIAEFLADQDVSPAVIDVFLLRIQQKCQAIGLSPENMQRGLILDSLSGLRLSSDLP